MLQCTAGRSIEPPCHANRDIVIRNMYNQMTNKHLLDGVSCVGDHGIP